MTDKLRLRRQTQQRYAQWLGPKNSWTGLYDRNTNRPLECGPVVELELGYRAALVVLGGQRFNSGRIT